MDDKWRAFLREAELAAEHMAIGATVIGRANYARVAYYAQAFFALSVGFERTAKLILILDFIIANNGQAPPVKLVTKDRHNLGRRC